MRKRTGRHEQSVIAWVFVIRPPRECRQPDSAPPPFIASGRAIGANGRNIDVGLLKVGLFCGFNCRCMSSVECSVCAVNTPFNFVAFIVRADIDGKPYSDLPLLGTDSSDVLSAPMVGIVMEPRRSDVGTLKVLEKDDAAI